jgi:hypothetical protein
MASADKDRFYGEDVQLTHERRVEMNGKTASERMSGIGGDVM